MATDRQLELLNTIVSTYIKVGEPVSSAVILELNPSIKLSSATIRNEMVLLEKEGYLVKLDSSSSRTSGRMPTNKGYEQYLKTIKTSPDSIISIKDKLDKILNKRKDDIDKVLSDAMEIINDSTNTLTITKDNNEQEMIVDINTYPVGEEKAVIIVVTSSGKVINNETKLNGIEYEVFKKSIETYSKRLKGTLVIELNETLKNLKEIVNIEIKELEDKFQNVIRLLVTKILSSSNKYQGMNSLMTAEKLDIKTQVSAIFKMIENNSIWDFISEDGKIQNDGTGVTVDVDTIDGVSVVKKNINFGDNRKELTILGSKDQDYQKLFSMLEYLESKIGGI